MPKFGVPFSGAADQMIGGELDAAKAAPFKSSQVDESRLGALKGDSKTNKSYDFTAMHKTAEATDGFVIMKPIESF